MGKSGDESFASLILSAFNLNEPHGEQHTAATTKRLHEFLRRDPEFREMLLSQVPNSFDSAVRPEFQVPMRFKLALVRVGLSMFQALYYREIKRICEPSQHILVRFATNVSIRDEHQALGPFLSLVEERVPSTADRRVPSRFRWGCREIQAGCVAIAAEIAGSTLWFGFVQDAAPDEAFAEKFEWFSGRGKLYRLTESIDQ